MQIQHWTDNAKISNRGFVGVVTGLNLTEQ